MDANELLRIINLAPFIRRLPEDDLVPWFNGRVVNDSDRFTIQDTGVLDPRLPAVLYQEFFDLDIEDDAVFPQDTIPRFVIVNALLGWKEPTVTTLRGRIALSHKDEPWSIHSVTNLNMMAKPGWHRIDVGMFTTRVTDDDIAYNRNYQETSILVEATMLDTTFPEWASRWSVSQGLGLSPRETAEMLFSEVKPVPDVNMSDVTFE